MVAVSASGLCPERFIFEGYLSKTKGTRLDRLKYLRGTQAAAVLFENPNRVIRTLFDVQQIFGDDHKVFLGVELTKFFESHIRGTVKEVLEKLQTADRPLKGEVTMVLEGFKLQEEHFEETNMTDNLTRKVNVLEAAKKLHELVEMDDKEYREMLKNLFGLTQYERNRVVRIVRNQVKDIDTKMAKFKENWNNPDS